MGKKIQLYGSSRRIKKAGISQSQHYLQLKMSPGTEIRRNDIFPFRSPDSSEIFSEYSLQIQAFQVKTALKKRVKNPGSGSESSDAAINSLRQRVDSF
jgi:hypothetical protein